MATDRCRPVVDRKSTAAGADEGWIRRMSQLSDERRGSAQPVTDFVGREAELRSLLSGLEQAHAGRGSLYLLGGEPGIGKSRLADEFARQARDLEARVIWGKCWEGAGAPAYWPWMQAIRGHLRSVDPEVARLQLGAGASDLAQLLPELHRLVPDLRAAPPDSDSARFQLFDSTATFLRSAADERTTVLILDDLHAGDTPSILLLRFLASQLGDMRLLVLGTYRDVALTPDHPMTAALGELAREPVTRLMSLQGLGEDVAGQFIELAAGAVPSARVVRGIWRETGGNPLFLKETTRLLLSEGGLDQALNAGPLQLAVPPGVREVISRRVHQLPEQTVLALTRAAALGPEFSVDVLRRLGAYPKGALPPVLEEASRAGLLTPVTGAPGRLRFSHDLVREAVYQEQAPTQRAALHAQIAETLEKLYGSSPEDHLAELAHHFCEAAQADDDGAGDSARRAQEYATRAGQLAARSVAYEEAARLLRMALAMLDRQASGDDDARAELLLGIGDAEARAGEMEAANVAFLAAADIARRTGEARHLGRAALGIGGRLAWGRPGDNTQLIPLLQEALVLLGGADEPLRVRLLTRLASAWRSSPDKRQESATLSQQALDTARQMDDPATLSYALAGRYWATWWPENPEERSTLAQEMVSLAERLGDGERMVDAQMLLWLSHTELGNLGEAASRLEVVRRLGAELRQPAQLWLGTSLRALVSLMKGEFDVAEQLIDQELEPGPPSMPNRDNVSAAAMHRFLLARERGRAAGVEATVRAAVGAFPWYPLHRPALALVLVDAGREANARGVFDELARNDFSALYRDNEWLLGMSLTSEACWRLADAAAAATLYGQLAPFAGRHAVGVNEGSVGAVDRYLGMLAATMGRLDVAATHLAEAVRINQGMGARPWTAHAQADLALVLRQRAAAGDLKRATDLELAARATALELGMIALERRLDELGAAAEAPAEVSLPAAGTFRREGEYWTVAFGEDAFRLRDSKGLHYLARLLAEPGRELLALELARDGGLLDAAAGNRLEPELRTTTNLGDAGVQLDEQAKGAYRARLHELQQELDEAEGWNDPERADRARSEMDFLARELARAVGLGGRDRSAASAGERARISVTRAIRLAMRRIAGHSSALGEHLEATIHTGTYCAYRPDSRLPVDWQQ
ncbi:AAA family ATPase [soil metagenome]